MQCHIKKDFAAQNITWKYDIIRYQDGYEWVLLDPELEIPNREVGGG